MSVNTPAEAAAKLRVLALRVATPFTANPETVAAVEASSSLLRTLLSAAAPKKTGAYAKSITTRTNISPGAAFIRGEGAAPLTNWIIGGTKAHDIYPMLDVLNSKNYRQAIRSYAGGSGARGRHALFWPGAAHPVAHVFHPGTQPNPWDEQPAGVAADMTGNLVADAMVRSMANAI